ncbi:hypothetical protein BCR34DRAFT_608679 [Clohesyomyces aquaticus]|uniref:Uncharacterized protein n=1 Tax=Clohesyomyces aquaticus TaxID=1231657 RepID=A0A1Y1Y4Q9_9PLEO|nr:hypothetical protein BCR34DRAFT_608679 [Clohesyomyces aquaticus]
MARLRKAIELPSASASSDDEAVARQLLLESSQSQSQMGHALSKEDQGVLTELAESANTYAPASPPKPLHPFKKSAVRGANLLNAARIERRPARPQASGTLAKARQDKTEGQQNDAVWDTREGERSGKLKRPSFYAFDLAKRARERTSIYEVPESPLKEDAPAPAPRKALRKGTAGKPKKVTAKTTPQAEERDQDDRESAENPNQVPSTPTGKPESPATEIHLPDGRLRCTGFIGADARLHGGEQCYHEGTVKTHAGYRCSKHTKPANVIESALRKSDRLTNSSPRRSGRVAGDDANISNIDWAKMPENAARQSPTHKRKSSSEQAPSARPEKSPRREEQEPQAVQKTGKRGRLRKRDASPQVVVTNGKGSKAHEAPRDQPSERVEPREARVKPARSKYPKPQRVTNGEENHDLPITDEPDEDEIVGEEPQPESRQKPRSRENDGEASRSKNQPAKPQPALESSSAIAKSRPSKSGNKATGPRTLAVRAAPSRNPAPGVDRDIPQDTADDDSEESRNDNNIEPESRDDGADEDNELDSEESDIGDKPIPDSLDAIIDFATALKRSGLCTTTQGQKIRRACNNAWKIVNKYDETEVEEVKATIGNIRKMLAVASGITDPDTRVKFKQDAYAYLFRSIIVFLGSVYFWAETAYGEGAHSLPALRILLPLIGDIILFKDNIYGWHAKIGPRAEGDRTFRNINQKIIAPLRTIHEKLRREQHDLAAAASKQEMLDKLRAERLEQQDANRRKSEALALRNMRWKRWQALHLARMECEPDPGRRRLLRITPIEDFDERDANGNRFERLPVFRDRITPPNHRGTPEGEREWEDEQMVALVDGLRAFAGPHVFERIFKEYCKPQGILRDFTVAEITAQATSLRAVILADDQGQGRESEEWVKRIPILP